MREHGGPGMERGPIDPRAGPPGMEPRDPRMRGDMRGPSDQRGPSGGRGPPDGRVPGDLRPPPDARDGWVPPDRRGGGSDPRSSPRGKIIFGAWTNKVGLHLAQLPILHST